MRVLPSLLCSALLAARCLPVPAAVLDDVSFTEVASGLGGAVAVRHAGDGSGRLFVVRQGGSIRIIDAAGTVLATPFLNIGSGGTAPPRGFTSGGERGLLGLAFHPQYASNRRLFVYYTDGNGDSVVAEYLVSTGNANLVDTSSARVVLRVYQPASNHNGGDIHFGADGYLYIGLGDGGGSNDPCNSGQSLTTATMDCSADSSFLGGSPAGNPNAPALLGKMLRIDVDSTNVPAGADLCGMDPAALGTPALRSYGIPSGNPFAGNSGSDAACDETYHYGLRNPWRFSFDRLNHDLIIGDVGQGTWEELDLASGSATGLNFGWKICEGFHMRGSTSDPCTLGGRTDPIVAYRNPTVGYSIAGGWRYRGPHAALNGVIFSGDYIGKVFAITQNGIGNWSIAKTYTPDSTGADLGSVVGLGEGEDGHLYTVSLQGKVFRIDVPIDTLFSDGFEGL